VFEWGQCNVPAAKLTFSILRHAGALHCPHPTLINDRIVSDSIILLYFFNVFPPVRNSTLIYILIAEKYRDFNTHLYTMMPPPCYGILAI
jgi:hypothetical protein